MPTFRASRSSSPTSTSPCRRTLPAISIGSTAGSTTAPSSRADFGEIMMLRQIGKRLLTVIPSLIGVIIVTFLLTRVLPGDTAAYFAGPAASAQAIEEVRKQLGLDKPLPEQFVRYVVDLAHGDFGKSLTTGQPVISDIAARLPASAELTLMGLIVAMLIAGPLGILAAVKQGSFIEH